MRLKNYSYNYKFPKLTFQNCNFNYTQWLAYRYRDWEILTWNTGNGINLRIPAPDELETKKPAVNGLIYECVQWKSNGSHAKRRR